MKKTTERRLAAAEQRLSPKGSGLQVIIVHGGFSETPRYADGGGRIWERGIDEGLETFERRVITEAQAAKLKLVVIGGLPPDGINSGDLEDFLRTCDLPAMPPAENV